MAVAAMVETMTSVTLHRRVTIAGKATCDALWNMRRCVVVHAVPHSDQR